MAKPKVYVETSVISYLTSRASRDVVVAGHQQVTHEWWARRRHRFHLVASEMVLEESSRGDSEASGARLEALGAIEILSVSEAAVALASLLVDRGPLPSKAVADALHIGVAVTNGVEYLLTWNCTHLANAVMRTSIEEVCRSEGFEPSIICTPEELLEE